MAASMREILKNPELKELKLGTPMRGVMDFSYDLTHERNERELPTPLHRASHLAIGAGELLDAVRVADKDILPIVSAKVAMRILSVLQGLGEDNAFIDALRKKYPEGGCSYCGNKPCTCGTDKPKSTVKVEATDAQKMWSIEQWQKNLKAVYGPPNFARGLDKVAIRIASEATEALQAILQMEKATSPQDKEKYKQEALLELADTFAWLLGVVNVLGPTVEEAPKLEKAFVDIYGKGCPNCGQLPCACKEPFGYQADRKNAKFKKTL